MAKILLVEDERSIRQALRFELEDEGHDVVYASDFTEAFSAVRAFQFDVIISDIYYSKGNGVQLMEMLKKLNKNIPFIMITAFPDSELAVKVQAVLKDRFFAKPFITHALKDKVSEVLSKNVYQPEMAPALSYCFNY